MILVDSNLLLYAHDEESDLHLAARRWLESTLSSAEPVGFSWICVLAFLRISTNARVLNTPLRMDEAISTVDSWLRQPQVVFLEPEERHWEILKELLAAGQVRSRLVMDAHLAALAIEHGAVLCTHDRDFARFPGLKMIDPLEA